MIGVNLFVKALITSYDTNPPKNAAIGGNAGNTNIF